MLKMGANIIDNKKNIVEFRVFAYDREKVELVLKVDGERRVLPMTEESPHVYSTVIEGWGNELLYKFKMDGKEEYPDPYSHYQPYGVHGFSRVVDHEYRWQNTGWQGRDPAELVTMEIHPGTFTGEGTFLAIANQLDYLTELGVNALELMPVTQTPGRWNWGYDGTNLFSVNRNYGTPGELKYLVDCCHGRGMAVILDVIYNHFGPEGSYLHAYGPYFTQKHKTPWGAAVNFDDAYNEFTRKMVLDNVRYWLETFRFDGLRLDAVHAIKDDSSRHILRDISDTARESEKRQDAKKFIIAESDENDVRLIKPVEEGGYGIDAQWMDDFHHCIHTALTGENQGYYMDYGRFGDLEKVFKNYLYTGEYSAFWGKYRGTDASHRPGKQFVVALQNHDQVGNRARGDRIASLVDFPYLKAAAGLVFFSPYLPLVFMGEEYAEKRPFLFFTDYGDPELQEAVYRGRREEFRDFRWEEHNVPDPQDQDTFYSCKLTPRENWDQQNRLMFNYYRDLIKLRKNHPVLRVPDKDRLEIKADPRDKTVWIKRWNEETVLAGLFNLGNREIAAAPPGVEIMNSEWTRYGRQPGSSKDTLVPGQMVIYESRNS